jgi:hypothetical protein
MTTNLIDCRNLVCSFINDINKVHEEHIDAINAVGKEKGEILTLFEESSKNNTYSEELENRYRVICKKQNEILKTFRRAQANVLDKHSMKHPADFFLAISWREQSFFFNDQIIEEKIINKNKIKIFTETIGYPNYNSDRYKVFILDLKDGKWVISKIRQYDPEKQKEYPLNW